MALAGYGIYVCTSTDRFVGRMLDAHAKAHDVKGHLLTGAFNSEKYIKGQTYCRIRRYANTIRIAIKELKRISIPQQEWTTKKNGGR